jgi:hypothetical protein
VRSSERVEVGLRDDGSASSVVVTQRLVISRVGDYSFTIPAPALGVEPAAGSQSQPGLRSTGIVWQGFSSGHRVLASRASLEPLAAERGLPLAIKIEQRGDATVVRVIDIARRKVQITLGTAPVGPLRTLLRGVRVAVTAPDRTALTRTLQVEGASRGPASVVADAPLRVRGTITVRGRKPLRIVWVLGGGQPLMRSVVLPGHAAPHLALKADPFRPEELLPRGDELTAAEGLTRLEVALARVALSAQYRQYLADPDQLGLSQMTYLFRTVAEPAPVSPQLRPAKSGSGDTLAIVLASVLGSAALVGLVVAWAHS